MDDPGARIPAPPADINADAVDMDARMSLAQCAAISTVVREYIARRDPDFAARMDPLSPYATLAAFLTIHGDAP